MLSFLRGSTFSFKQQYFDIIINAGCFVTWILTSDKEVMSSFVCCLSSFVCCLFVSSKLHKNYLKYFHKCWWTGCGICQGRSFYIFVADPDRGTRPGISFTFLNFLWDRGRFYFAENNSWIVMKKSDVFRGLMFIRLSSFEQIEIKIQI